MDFLNSSKELIQFINKSVSVYHAVEETAKLLSENGFIEIFENEKWHLKQGKSYFVKRNQSSIIAFTYPKTNFKGFNIVASHSDSPCFKLKENFEIKACGNYTKLNTEKYGGMIMSTWCDRALSVAGRVTVKTENGFDSKLLNIDKDLLVIPNPAIHIFRDQNENRKFNAQIDMLPLLGDENADLKKIIANELSVNENDIISHELYLYPREKGKIIGANNEYIMSAKIDDLQCVFSSATAISNSVNHNQVCVCAVMDNEEIGSTTKQGANSTFLQDTLKRICEISNKNNEDYRVCLANSFMISADNAHSMHPNFAEKSDSTNNCFINKGPVIKFNANQSYSSDAISASMFKTVCKNANVPCQVFHNRSDMPSGGTLGNISNSQVSMNTLDIGMPQFAMHSAIETAGTKDTSYAIESMREFYSTEFEINNNQFKMKSNITRFVIASHNKHKIEEFTRILQPLGIELITADLSEVDENGNTFMENSLLKSNSACKETGLPAIADDSGLCVDALGGEPGVRSARYAEEGKKKATVLEKLKNERNRSANFTCAITCVFPNGDTIKIQEQCDGEIATELMGENGFGYDPIFVVGDRSFAQMTDEEKDAISHRGKALRAFKIKLQEYFEQENN